MRKHQTVSAALITMALNCGLSIFDAVPLAVTVPAVSTASPGRTDQEAAGSNANIDRTTISREIESMMDGPSQPGTQNPLEGQVILKARKDLSRRLSIKPDQVKLLEIRKVTWPDSSLGCPKPGKVYSQVLRDGFLIRLQAGGGMYFYHSAANMNPFLCEETSRIVPRPKKGDEFVPPPGSEID